MSEPTGPASEKEPRYSMARVEADAERGRLEKLEGLNDPATLRRIDTIGVEVGWRCVEIGAGAGSIARALSERVGHEGLVVAADLDPRFLGDFAGPGREVVTHDITNGPVPPGGFDFAHCRAVVAHIEDPSAAVRNIVESARPGGWVLCEEPDYGSMAVCDLEHRYAPDLVNFHAIMTMSGRFDGSAGRNTFKALRDAGLTSVQSDTNGAIAVGGDARAQFRQHGLQNARSLILDSGFFDQASFDRMIAMFDDPTFAYIENTWIASWGQVPTE